MELDEGHGTISSVSHQKTLSRITDRTLVQTGSKYLVAITTIKIYNKGKKKRNYEAEYIQYYNF